MRLALNEIVHDGRCLKDCRFIIRAGGRATDSGVPSLHHGGPKFKIKQKNHCLQKSKLVDWRGQALRLKGQGSLWPPLDAGLVYLGSCAKALGMCDSAIKVDQNWFVKRIAKSSIHDILQL